MAPLVMESTCQLLHFGLCQVALVNGCLVEMIPKQLICLHGLFCTLMTLGCHPFSLNCRIEQPEQNYLCWCTNRQPKTQLSQLICRVTASGKKKKTHYYPTYRCETKKYSLSHVAEIVGLLVLQHNCGYSWLIHFICTIFYYMPYIEYELLQRLRMMGFPPCWFVSCSVVSNSLWPHGL